MAGFPLPPGFTPQENLRGAFSGTLYQTAQTVVSTQVLGPNPNRNGLYFFNKSNVGNCVIAFATTASLTAHTWELGPSGSWAAPYPHYCGPVYVAWDTAGGGSLMTTETV